jgi:hypothetical protein
MADKTKAEAAEEIKAALAEDAEPEAEAAPELVDPEHELNPDVYRAPEAETVDADAADA